MKLQPIEKPKSLHLRLVYWLTQKQFGKVITPLKVIYARKPALIPFIQRLFRIDQKKIKRPEQEKELIRHFTSLLNGCAFCQDTSQMRGEKANIPLEKFRDLLKFEDSKAFDPDEKVMLSYVRELVEQKKVSEDTYSKLSEHFSEEGIIEITWIASTEVYMNLMNQAFDIRSDGFCEKARRG